MSYSRREVIDHKTIIDKELYDNVQDGIDEAFEKIEKIKEETLDSGVTSEDGTKYRWGVDSGGIYLESVDTDLGEE